MSVSITRRQWLAGIGCWTGAAWGLNHSRAQSDDQQPSSAAATVWLEPRARWSERGSTSGREADGYRGLSARDLVRSEVMIERFDAQAIEFRKPEDETPNSLVESRVIWLQPQGLSESAQGAITALHQQDAAVDLAALMAELQQPQPAWRSQWLGMHVWQASYLGEKSAATLELINQLDAQAMPSLYLGGLPIRWSDEPISAIARAAAKDCLSEKREATQLTAASWLFEQGSGQDAELSTAARETLERLERDSKRKPIRALAKMLLAIPLEGKAARQLNPETLLAWERLPITLSAGPTQRLAHWYRQRGEQTRAVELSLRLILTSPRPNPLSRLPKESEELWQALQVKQRPPQ